MSSKTVLNKALYENDLILSKSLIWFDFSQKLELNFQITDAFTETDKFSVLFSYTSL